MPLNTPYVAYVLHYHIENVEYSHEMSGVEPKPH